MKSAAPVIRALLWVSGMLMVVGPGLDSKGPNSVKWLISGMVMLVFAELSSLLRAPR